MVTSLPEKIASEITLSNNPGVIIKKWRETFKITQLELAQIIKLKSSVISDYEHGRRHSPGIGIIRKIIEGMIEIDRQRGSPIINKYSAPNVEAIIDIQEFFEGKAVKLFTQKIQGEVLYKNKNPSKLIYGYTIIDSVKAIMTFSAEDYLRIFGWNSDRALIFTGVKFGRSPMIAIRTHSLKPQIIVYHKPERIDPLAVKLAELENITFMKTDLPLKKLIVELKEM